MPRVVRFFAARGDRIYCFRVDAIAGTTVRVAAVGRDPKTGRMQELFFEATSNNDRLVAPFNSADTWNTDVEIVGLAVGITAGSPKRGQFYIRIYNGPSHGPTVIASGYVYSGGSLGLGEFHEPGPGGGEGFLTVFTGADPAAQTNPSDAVPTNAVWRLIAYQVQLISIAGDTAAPRLIVETPTRVRKFLGGLQDAVAGAETQTYVWCQGHGALVDSAPTPFSDTETISVRAEIPDRLFLSETDIIRLLTAGTFGATSNYGAPSITVEEWLVL